MTRASFLGEFLRSTHRDVFALMAAARAGDPDRVGELAHRIEGASKIVGAQPLADACAAVAASALLGAPDLQAALDDFLVRLHVLDAWIHAVHPEAAQGRGLAANADDRVCRGFDFLVVEQHDFQRALTMRLLRQLGARDVLGFADAAGALAAARKLQEPAVLVINFARLAGSLEVMQFVGREHLPVSVILTSACDEEMLRWPAEVVRSCGVEVLGAARKPLTARKLALLFAPRGADHADADPSRPLVT